MNESLPAEFGPYTLLDLLGEGGMARVYRAVRTGPMGFRKELAVKRLKTDVIRNNERFVQALLNEARLGGELRHPNIVDIYEFGLIGEEHYIAMEYVSGLTLDAIIHRNQRQGVHLPVGVVLDMAQQACAGLDYAHRQAAHDGRPMKLVHRDLKPANIIVTTTGMVKIMDFGIARVDMAERHKTTVGVLKGTVSYMSPEQLRQEMELDRRSDIFSLGAVLFQALTNEPLMVGQSVESVLFNVMSGKFRNRLALIEAKDPGFAAILGRCLEMEREERYHSASDLAADLRNLHDRRGDRLGCSELMQLLTTGVGESGSHSAAAHGEILQRARRSPGDSDWIVFADTLRDADGAGRYTPPPRSPSNVRTLVSSDEEESYSAATVMWQAPDTGFTQATTAHETYDGERDTTRWGLWVGLAAGLVVLMGLCTGGTALYLHQLASREARTPVPLVGGEMGTEEPTAVVPDEATESALPDAQAGLVEVEPDGDAEGTEPEVDAQQREEESSPTPAQEEKEVTPAAVEPVESTPVTVSFNSIPWSYWELTGDAEAGGGSDHVPHRGELPPGKYQLTLREPRSGEIHTYDIRIRGDEGSLLFCWDFTLDAPCELAR